ncbi:DUF3237 domain-containing protein [Novosphingobium terrae]|uniref:DUF3237 domain-containing protein n=1 Tax=Novosphingobium terrae TaxID=2726189 RepID=UPI00198012A9|nr:DUF3237 domain-containing protein [Novosphingobium terrae]
MSNSLSMAAALLASSAAAGEPVPPPAPQLEYAFSAQITLDPPLEMGSVDGARRRYIGITGGTITGPMLQGTVLPGGGDWQSIEPDGLTHVEAHYALKAADGTVIEISNPGVRVASPEVSERLARGEEVDPSAYYFRTTPRFTVKPGPHDWLTRHAFVARGIRLPHEVRIDVFVVR